jgi:esterase/lipase superfamily enzyme
MNRFHAKARFVLVAAAAVALAACASRPGPETVRPHPHALGVGKVVTVFVATLRAPAAGKDASFTTEQSQKLSYARYAISIPPGHRPDVIEWPKGPPDPSTDFVTLEARRLSENEFRAEVGRGKPVRLFVHGFNNSFEESLYRNAQLAADVRDGRISVLFAWPSNGDPLSYGADRAAAAASVDGLAKTIDILAARPRARPLLLAHSMGGWLTIEALAKLSQERGRAVFGGLSNVVLAAPDIGVDEMVRRLEIIGPFPRPLTVLVAGDDGALNLSRIISGHRRVGSDDVRDQQVQAAAKRYHVRIIDISEVKASDGFRHGRFTAMAAHYRRFHAQLEDSASLHYAKPGVFVFKTLRSTFVPLELAGR